LSTSTDQDPTLTAVDRRERARAVATFVIGAFIAAFALLNLDEVKVRWVVATGRTPLIVVILLAFLLGAAADRIVTRRARRKKQQTD
jgi:uncharacterized integral membrane protein